jgi:hypothetical protein
VAELNPKILKEMQVLFKESSKETIGFPYGGKTQNYKANDK